ncbi:MAG: hypothetical protein VX563_08330 [Planctomycetota bacterium]|nr:hypothetical protein [Planctomycetota bacterium]
MPSPSIDAPREDTAEEATPSETTCPKRRSGASIAWHRSTLRRLEVES